MATSVSTKTGDKGQSGLANGQRVGKDELIFEVLGTQDELNSWLGMAIAQMSDTFAEQHQFLYSVQEKLFYLGAELALSPLAKLSPPALKELEKMSTDLQESMGENWTTKFLYPGGNRTAATLDVARTVSRRFERLVVKLSRTQAVSPTILKYVNRLSDYLYVLRCYVNFREEVTEHPFVREKSL